MKILVLIVLFTGILLSGCTGNQPPAATQSPAVSTGTPVVDATPMPNATETPMPGALSPTPASPNEDAGSVDSHSDHDNHEGHSH